MPGPSPSAHQVLVYSGPGVSPLSLSHTILTLSLLLLPHYTVQPATVEVLSTQPWEPACALLVVPGGRDLPYVHEMSVKSRVAKRISEYVRGGGRYLGICAGAYFGSEEVRFDQGGDMEVIGKRELAFFPGVCAGPTYPGFAYAAESGSRAVPLHLEPVQSGGSRRIIKHIYYNGGGHFLMPDPVPGVQVIARYADAPEQSGSLEGAIAAVLVGKGKGKAVLCSVHPEYPLNDPPARDAILKLDQPPSADEVAESDKARMAWMEELLATLGLSPPRQSGLLPQIASNVEEDPALLLHPTHPSPIFVLPLPILPELATGIFAAPKIQEKLSDSQDGPTVLRDGNDELHILDTHAFGGESSAAAVTRQLADARRRQPVFPPTVDRLSLEPSETTPPPPPAPDFHSSPKTVIVPSRDIPYSPSWTPLFSFETYWSDLAKARKENGKKHGQLRRAGDGKRSASLGDLVWYAETVTSTQTMIDRNPILLANLTSPLVFLASFQLAGRGRGSNVWLSPPGCLQYSILVTLPSRMSSKLVFIQYLMALAVAEAVDPDGRLGVRIKWPNDIYAEIEGVGDTKLGDGKKGRAKLGGILVNTNLINGEWRIVIGCGINVLNALPTTSLSHLHNLLAARSPDKTLPPAPTMEGSFARIMDAFESKWDTFLEEGGFTSFLDEYYGRWLHSNQEVTLTTVEPHQKLRIHSITSDYGLLRCKPIHQPSTGSSRGLTPLYDRGDFGGDDRTSSSFARVGAKKGSEEWVDLQPDGNSFDLMSGLIKRKA